MSRPAGPPDVDDAPSEPIGRVQNGAPEPTGAPPLSLRTHVMTVALEDYFHAAPFRPWVREEIWYRFEDRLAASALRMLELFHRHRVHATFFVTPRIAEAAPDLVREIVSQGHEIAAAGDLGRNLGGLDRQRFLDDAKRDRVRVERIVGREVLGYRVASGWLSPADVWILDALAEAGYRYDSSIRPALFSNPDEVWRRTRRDGGDERPRFFEIPVSSLGIFGLKVPIAGGGPFRHFPEYWTRRAIAHWDRHRDQPCVVYLRTWELDTDQPRISAPPLHERIRHYRNLRRMPRLLEEVLSSYRFTSIAGYLDIAPRLPAAVDRATMSPAGQVSPTPVVRPVKPRAPADTAEPTPVSVVVPCYNESQSLGYLSKTLDSVRAELGDRYAFTFIFVDDRSTDTTWLVLQDLFAGRPGFAICRHAENRGVAAAIQTGIRQARDEIVCSIDCDCTYDPHDLGRMIPLLTEGVDLVTASPYHPLGSVRNVPAWRLLLSKGLSRLYRLVLRQSLSTYTSCFRVYRRQTVASIELRLPGYLGLTELLGRLDQAGRRVVECPSTLEVRVLGFSKMKVLRNIVGHLQLLGELTRNRIFRRRASIGVETSAVEYPL
jgi:polysaccharide deacetylase family protein (PEP-CTERM system associated)